MNRLPIRRTIPAFSTALALALAVALPAAAQAPTPAAPAEAGGSPPLKVGDATQRLLALQAEGSMASATPRPIAGDVAQKSYERYLKTFDQPIPASFGSSVKAGGSSGASSTR